MVLPGHLAGGYLATYAILSMTQVPFTTAELTALYTIGILSGDSPDIDLLWFYFENRKTYSKLSNHREHITHTPFFWLILCGVISYFGFIIGSPFIIYSGILILTGALTHFLLDSIEYGIRWFWPFTKKRFSLSTSKEESGRESIRKSTISDYWNYILKYYLKQITFYAEILIVLVALFVFLSNL